MDILNETGFGVDMNCVVEEEGSVELDESELFLDDNEEEVNLGGIVGSSSEFKGNMILNNMRA